MQYEQVYSWVKASSLVVNRVGCINNVLSSSDGSDACRIVYKRGVYRVLISGVEFCRYRVYDVDSANLALERVSTLFDGLWLARRACLTFT